MRLQEGKTGASGAGWQPIDAIFTDGQLRRWVRWLEEALEAAMTDFERARASNDLAGALIACGQAIAFARMLATATGHVAREQEARDLIRAANLLADRVRHDLDRAQADRWPGRADSLPN